MIWVFIILAVIGHYMEWKLEMKRWAVSGDIVLHDCHGSGKYRICLSLDNNLWIERKCACWTEPGFVFPKKIRQLQKLYLFKHLTKGYGNGTD